MKHLSLLLAVMVCASCTTRYQVRGTEAIYKADHPLDLNTFVLKPCTGTPDEVCDTPQTLAVKKARQTSLEHQSVEYFGKLSTGVIEISDDGNINRRQYGQVMSMVRKQTAAGGLLVVFAHGWHHGPHTCDRDLCCFRRVLEQLQKLREARHEPGNTVGVFIGWRGESMIVPYLNTFTIYDRKRVAQRIGRTAGKEILLELDRLWRLNDKLVMVAVGHSLGGAFMVEAMRGKLTGDVSDIEIGEPRNYRIVRSHDDRVPALEKKRKAERADVGDLVVLVNPAIEAIEWEPFEKDLFENAYASVTDRKQLVDMRLPYDKPYQYEEEQLPVLMAVASQGDMAVKYSLPFARWVQGFLTLHWNWLFNPVFLVGIGRYDPYMTHTLEYHGKILPPTEEPNQLESPTCDCPMSYEGVSSVVGFHLDHTDREQTFGDGYVMKPTDDRKTRGWDIHSPYFSVFTDPNVISAHSDIFNARFVGFLAAFINAYDEKVQQIGRPKERGAAAAEQP